MQQLLYFEIELRSAKDPVCLYGIKIPKNIHGKIGPNKVLLKVSSYS